MFWYIILVVVLVLAIILVGYFYITERRYLAKKTSEVMSQEIKEDIEAEREQALERKNKFQKEMNKAKEKE